MEACPRLPAISFDSKICIESVNLCEKIPHYITSTYQENGEKYANECEQINRLRQNAINASNDEAGIQILKRYYCQLQLLRNRFPMLPETECAVRFTWEDGFQKEDNTFNDVRFEEAAILYNIGALYSRLGANEARRTHESIKNACTYFRCAAACFEKVRDSYTTYTSDLTPDLLTCQVHILLAQAHESVLEKSLLDQRPASVNGHVAMQISEYYQMALLNLTKPGINSIVSKRYRDWRVALTYKLSYYFALTYYCCGLVAEEGKKRGQAVCYYEAAVERLKEAWKNAEKISSDRTAVFKDTHQFTNDVLAGKFKGAKRDNDSVYFEKVPTLASLPAVQGAVVAKPQPFDCHDPEVCGTDIFQKLVPMDAHLATSEYSEEKAKLLREIIELTENKNRELETFLRCLQLDRLPLNNEYLRLPRELLDCCATVSARPSLVKELVTSMQQLNSQHHDVTEQVSDFEQAFKTLEETNESIKTSKEFQDLKTNLKTIRDMMLQANESNIELHRHMTLIIEHLKILSSPLDQLEKTLPIITEIDDEANKSKFARLALLNEKIETMKKQRETLMNDFRRRIQDDDITKLVLMQRQENHTTLFAAQVKKHEELLNIIKQNCVAQDNILQSLTDANADIADIRTKIGATFEGRNRLIQEYINSFKSFEDTLSKANEGVEFYKKQSVKLNKLNERLAALQAQQPVLSPPARPSFQRPSSSRNLPSRQSALPTGFSPAPQDFDYAPQELPSTMPDRPRLKDYLAAMKPDTWGSSTGRPSKRSSTKFDETMYMPPPPSSFSNTYEGPSFYHSAAPPASMPSFNPRHQQVQSPLHTEQMSYNPPPSSYLPQPGYNPSRSIDPNVQSFSQQPQFYPPRPPQQQQQQPVYQPPPVQHPGYQPQPAYQPPPPAQYSSYQPPPSPQQPSYPPQTVYQPALPQQSFQQPIPYQQPMYQPPPSHHQPMPPAEVPPASVYPNPPDANRAAQQGPPPKKFDPYRPQPLGAYDIPKSQVPTYTHQPPPPTPQQQQQQQAIPPAQINPHDVYRPGGLMSTSNPHSMPAPPMNNNHYNANQYAQHNPAPVTLTPTPSSSMSNPPAHSISKPTVVTNIVDDLLSLALEQHIETLPMAAESPVPFLPPATPVDEDQPSKSHNKPIACIQPLSMSVDEIHPTAPSSTPVAHPCPPQDPYDDKDKLDQLLADAQRFEKHISTMTKKTLNGTVPLEVEWKELADLQEKDLHTQTCAIGKCNPKLNRFQDLIPYDNSRVSLTQSNPTQQKHFNDYINATSIGRIRDTCLLISQYPLATTIGDYWSMIYDQHVAIVVVLLRTDEMQPNVCPQKIGEELKFSSITVTLLSTKSPSPLTHHKIIRVHHSSTNQSRTVVWLEHVGWPPKDMPENPIELLKFIREVQHFLLQTRNRRSTILATCLNGVSRTGPFLALFTCIQDIDEGRCFPDLNKIIRVLRTKRRHVIQDMNQLKFLYETLLYYVQDFLVKRGVLNVGTIAHYPQSTGGKSSSIHSHHTALFEDEVQTIMDRAKPVVQSTPNYDVGPILLSTPIIEERSPSKQLSPIEENFNLRPEESHVRPKTKRDDFFRAKPSPVADLSDPFNTLDPLWTHR